jgi:alpha-N-arabinofuranosidase
VKKRIDRTRRKLMLAGLAAAGMPAAVHAPKAAGSAFATSVTLALGQPGKAANAFVLGSNCQWMNDGDGLLQPGTLSFAEPMLTYVKALSPTVLRFPGGSLADTYHWRNGVGALAQRKPGEVFYDGSFQPSRMGTQELLELCEATGAAPLISVNAITGTAQEAADWVTYVNKGTLLSRLTGRPLPKVQTWEIGNEPYLKDEKRTSLWTAPDVFAQRATQFIKAMAAVDPSIAIGIPLRSDTISGIPMSHYPGYNDTVLRGIGVPFQFAALHDAYMPFGLDRAYSDAELYSAAMAATRVVAADFAATRAQIAALRPGPAIPFAVTEHSAFFTSGVPASDRYIASLAGAMYVADLLCLLAATPDLALANYWSLSGNWFFGAIDESLVRRPVYYVLQAFRSLLRGTLIPAQVAGRTFTNLQAGLVPRLTGTPSVSALATREGQMLRLVLVNKDASDAAAIRLELPGGGRPTQASLTLISGRSVFDEHATSLVQSPSSVRLRIDSARFSVPEHSIAYLELRLASSS